MHTRPIPLALLLLAACSPAPDPCNPMCTAAAQRYGTCLEAWGTDWQAAGYQDEADFLDACDTWVWVSRELEADAGTEGRVDAECREKRAVLEQGTCDDFLELDWSESP